MVKMNTRAATKKSDDATDSATTGKTEKPAAVIDYFDMDD
jgi:hypothetical protein